MWRRHPVTDMVFNRYIPDFRSVLEQQALNGWIRGILTLQAEDEARGYILGAHMMEGLNLAAIRQFYNGDQ